MLRIISERILHTDEELCACFIDWQKACDHVNWTKLMQILKGIGIDWRERRLISKLYMEQIVKIRLDQGETRSVKIGRGVREDCCLSPILFNLYSEYFTKEALEGFGDFKIGGQVIRTVKYADDLVLLDRKETVLRGMIHRLSEIGRRYGMDMNVEKTKVMRISRQPAPIKVRIDQKQLENVEYFNYLGNMIKMMQSVKVKLNPELSWFKEETSKVQHLEHSFICC
jgi:hypothetical protein